MNNFVTYIFFLGLVLSGCESNGNDESNPLAGKWITEACEQVSDTNNVLINFWAKGAYEFTEQGTILYGFEIYSDSNCITFSRTQLGNNAAVYKNLGPLNLQEGVDGGGLEIGMGTRTQFLSIDAFYTISNSVLCFSDVFTFEVFNFGIAQSGTAAIDFNRCLRKP